jgi:general secretion pathway protein F
MALYRYRAVGGGGELLKGVSEGSSAAEIAAALQKRGAMVLAIAPARRGLGMLALDLGGGGALKRGELTDATRELASMLGAGQDLDRSLRLMTEEAPNKRVAAVLGRVRDLVRNGSALAAALQSEPKSFTRLYIGLVRAGEAGGQLGGTLERLAGLLERQRAMQAAIQSAMLYPAILVVAATGSITLLLTEVLPLFVPLFAQNGVTLPASTAFLLAAGHAVSAFGLYALAALIALGVLARQAVQKPGPRLAADRLLLRLPLLGGLSREILAAQFARTLGMLLVNGVPLLAALGIVRDVLGNKAAQGAVTAAMESAKSGQGLATALERAALFPSRMVHLLRLGEATAQLGPLALRAADIHEERTRQALQRLVALLVPAITILMGAAIAGIVSSLLLAMLSLNDIAQ